MFGVRAAGTCRVADLPQPVGEHPSRPFDSPGRQEPAAVGPHSWHSESAGSCLPGAPWGWGEAGGSRSTSSRASTALRGRTPTCGGSEAPGRARARVPRRLGGFLAMPSELDARADSASQSDLHGDGCSRPLERGAQQCL
ncbi:unnamed protein product [Prorocentrum cordatum]|uniref:Uncharacterized protein n=1 Tax=Prorocentrum cordatum TaxID=2364126 RepID=A0ABN9WJX7_9DINO|nr:unnamed protein product [Polarella glacialis]